MAACAPLGGQDPVESQPSLREGDQFVDDFSPPDNAWPTGGVLGWRFEDGAYVSEGAPGESEVVYPRTYPADASVTVRATFRFTGEPLEVGGIFSIVCRLSPNSEDYNGYAASMQITEEGAYYGLLRWNDGEISGLVPAGDPADEVKYGSENTLALRCTPSGDSMQLEMSLNGRRVASVTDRAPHDLDGHAAAGLHLDTVPLRSRDRFDIHFERFELQVE